MSLPQTKERRRRPRLNVEQSSSGTMVSKGLTLKDISSVGAAAYSDAAIEEFTQVAIRLELGDPAEPLVLECTGVVVRCERQKDGRFEIGLFFSDLSPEKEQEVECFIAEALSIDSED